MSVEPVMPVLVALLKEVLKRDDQMGARAPGKEPKRLERKSKGIPCIGGFSPPRNVHTLMKLHH